MTAPIAASDFICPLYAAGRMPCHIESYRVVTLSGGYAAASEGSRYRFQLSGSPDGAARRMKRTGAGGRGGRRMVIDTSSGRRSPLRRLHGAHAVTTFSQTESPPRLRGTTWSRVSRPPLVPQ